MASVPAVVDALRKLGDQVLVQSGAGLPAGFPDRRYQERGARIATDRAEIFRECELILQVRSIGANPKSGRADLDLMRRGQVVIGHGEPLTAHEATRVLADRGVTFFAMELIPRITRAQSMDALSSQANLAGYRAVLMAAEALSRVFPMMMTAAGTAKPVKVFVVGAGVAGLQAIATARRLGAVVSAIDVRPEVREQIESLGAKFIAPPEAAAGSGGYAKEMTAEQRVRQQQLMSDAVGDADVVITTAAVPGRKAPVLVTAEMIGRMRPGSVVVDLAAERGGNCEPTRADETVEHHGVKVIGTTNLPSTLAHTASTMYANNVLKLVQHLLDKEGRLALNLQDEITAGTLVCHEGKIVHSLVCQAMGIVAT